MSKNLGSNVPIKDEKGNWYNTVVDENGEICEKIGGTYNEVQKRMKEFRKSEKTVIEKEKKDKLKNDIFQIESLINFKEVDDFKLDNGSVDTIDHIEEELSQKKEEYRSTFDKSDKEAAMKARNLLLSIMTLYFEKGLIGENQYLSYKMDVEQKSLQSLIFQLDQAKKTIYKISESIHLDLCPSGQIPRMIEVLTGLQRVVLDISKYQHEFIRDIEKQVRELKNEMIEENKLLDNNSITEDAQFSELQDTVLPAVTQKRLLDDIKKFIRDTQQDLYVQKSQNEKLNNTENINFVENDNKHYFDIEIDQEVEGNVLNGLDSWEISDKQSSRRCIDREEDSLI